MRQQFCLGLDAEIEVYPEWGPPDSATVSVFTSGTSAIVDEATATVDPVDTEATATLGSRQVTLADLTGVVSGRRYWLEGEDNLGYEVQSTGFHSGHIYLEEASRMDTQGHEGSLKGLRVAYSIASALVSSVTRRVRVRWSLVYGAEVRRITQLVDFVNVPFCLPVTERDLEEADPKLGAHGGLGKAWTKLVDRARKDIWRELVGWGMEPDLVLDRSVLVGAAVYRTHQLRYLHSSDMLSQRYGELYREELAALRSTSTIWYDEDGDLAVDNDDLDEYGADHSQRYDGEGASELGTKTRYLGVS